MIKKERMMNVQSILIKEIKMKNNSREIEDVSQLMTNIKHIGLLEPIEVRVIDGGKYKYEVVFGNRRFVSCKKLQFKYIDAIVHQEMSEADYWKRNFSENYQREDVTAFQMGRSINKLHKLGLNQKEVMSQLGLERGKYNTYVNLCNELPEDVQKRIKPGIKNFRTKASETSKGRQKKNPDLSVNLSNSVVNISKELHLGMKDKMKLIAYIERPDANQSKLKKIAKTLALQRQNRLPKKSISTLIKEAEKTESLRFELLMERKDIEGVLKNFKSKAEMIRYFGEEFKQIVLSYKM